MPSTAAIRIQIETALAQRIPSALSPRPKTIRPVAPTGISEIDALFEGGLPVGAITEMVGPESSGRTAVALSFVTRVTRSGNVCAWIDGCDALCPESAAEAGVDLSRMLWVRCGAAQANAKPAASYQFALPGKYMIPAPVKRGLHGGGCGGHPRNEVKGLSQAVSGLLRQEATAPRCAEPQPRVWPEREIFKPQPRMPQANLRVCRGKPWARIEQALKVADLLLQAGGFGAIVLDMADIAAEYVARVPPATWFRYRAAAERTQASVLLLAQYPCAKSSCELSLRLQTGEARNDEATVFTGIEHRLGVERRRFIHAATNVVTIRKPPQSMSDASWRSQPAWMGAR